jgi:hypothetical protein
MPPQRPSPARPWMRLAVLAMVIWFGGARPARAQEPPGTIFAAIRAALQQQQLRRSDQIGFNIMRSAFSDVPADGGVLIGFDVQLAKFLDHEIVHAVKPIYLTQAGNITAGEFGTFGNKPGQKKKSDLTRVLRLAAPQGFAVGTITLRHGLYLDSMHLTYHRIKGNALDNNDAVVSGWVGSNKAGQAEKTLGGSGAPIVGIFGNMDDRRVLALGVYLLPVAPAAVVAAPIPRLEAREELPALPKRTWNKRAEAAEAAEAPAEPARRDENEVAAEPPAAKKEPAPAPKAQPQDPHPAWLPLGIFGCVSVVLIIGCWLAFAGKSSDRPERVAKKKPRTTPPPIPQDDDEPAAGTTPGTAPVTAKAPPPSGVPSGAFAGSGAFPHRDDVLPQRNG